jgi:peptide chain release factor 2
VLQPYQMVKDLRTGVSTSNTGAVLDGDLDQFMESALAQRAFGTGPANVEDVD